MRSSRIPAVALLSAAALMYEILLVRVFAIETFHHFAYLSVGLAMLGCGAGGTALALATRARPGRAPSWFRGAAALAPAAFLAGPALVHRIPLDPVQLPWDPAQWLLLALTEILLAFPFGIAGSAILLALSAEDGPMGEIYAASFWGAGLGAGLSILVLGLAGPAQALAAPAVLAAAGAVDASRTRPRSGPAGPRFSFLRTVAWASLALALLAIFRPPWQPTVSPYKGLPQVEAYPGAKRVSEGISPVGWIVEVEARAFRYAPGLSLAYRGVFPRQNALFADGQLAGAATDWTRDDALELLDYLPTAFPYALGRRDRTLVIGAGDGVEVPSALVHGARRVVAVELHPELLRLVRERAAGLGAKSVEWVGGDARGFLARTEERFDLVTLGVGGALGTSAAGVHALDEDFLHTTEAYEAYLGRLRPGGVLAITRWLTVPPREPVRVILTACEALRRAGLAADRGLIVMRSWATATVLVRPFGFTPEDVDALRSWAAERRFDLDWTPGLEAPPAEPFNVLEGEPLHRAARAAAGGREGATRFSEGYPFLVDPVPDARPYPHHFLGLESLGMVLGPDRGGWLPFAEWGFIALAATLVLSVLLAGPLLVFPASALGARESSPGLFRVILYFAAIGLAYLATEIAAIQQLSLLLGHPVYAVAATLAATLVFSGIGSAWSDSLEPSRARPVLAVLSALLVAWAALQLAIVHWAEPAPLLLRSVVALLLLAPPAFLMGAPFPLGLRSVAGEGGPRIAWAWAANGFASVVAAPLSALIALGCGTRALILMGAGAYLGALALSGTLPRRSSRRFRSRPGATTRGADAGGE